MHRRARDARYAVDLGTPFATSFQAEAPSADRVEATDMAKNKVGKAKPESKSAVHAGMAPGFVSAPKPVLVEERERAVLTAAWGSQYHDGRFPVGDGQWAEVEHLGKSAQGAVASCVKKGWLLVQGSGKKGDEVVHIITAAGAAAIGMPSTREEWEKAKAIGAQTSASAEPAAGTTQAEVPAAGPAPEAPIAPGAPAAITAEVPATAPAAKVKAKKAARSKEPQVSTAGKPLPCTGTARCRCAPDRKSCLNAKAPVVVPKKPEVKA